LEIRDLQANADQFNIFLLGLQDLSSVDQSDFTSYFQIAGTMTGFVDHTPFAYSI
jgi:tyrosinase